MKTNRELAMMLAEFADHDGEAEKIAAVREFGLANGALLAHLSARECERLCENAALSPSLGAELHDAVRKSPGTTRVD